MFVLLDEVEILQTLFTQMLAPVGLEVSEFISKCERMDDGRKVMTIANITLRVR